MSHSSKDQDVVRALAERLRTEELRVWFDEWEIKPGDNIPAKIEEGLEHSRVLVLCMSANAFGSDWAHLEAGTFRFRDPLGIRPWLDEWNLSPGDTVSDALEKAITVIPCAALCFGPADIGKWHTMEIRAYIENWASGDARMIPVILPDVKEAPKLPLFVRQTLWVDMRDWENDQDDGYYRLVCGILGKAPGDSPMKKFGARDVAEWQGTGP